MAGNPLPPLKNRGTLALCLDVERCAEEIAWLSELDALGGERVDVADTILELDVGDWRDGVSLPDRFRGGIQKAIEEYKAKRLSSADSALSEAERALDAWPDSPSTQELFDLFFLKGAVRFARGPRNGHEESFRQAAALAWNREVRLPIEDESAIEAYYFAQSSLVSEGTGTLRVEQGLPGVHCSLDGVLLGPPPVEVRVFGGRHRLTAVQDGTLLKWKRDILVPPGRSAAVKPSFNRVGDTRWVYEQLLTAIYKRRIDSSVAELLGEWCRRHDLVLLRIARVEAVKPPAPAPVVVHASAENAEKPAIEETRTEARPKAGEGEIPIYDQELLDALNAPPPADTVEAVGSGGRRFRLRQVFFDPARRSLKNP